MVGKCTQSITCSQSATTRKLRGRLVQLEFSAAFDRGSLLYKLRSIGVEGQFSSIESEFLNEGRHAAIAFGG